MRYSEITKKVQPDYIRAVHPNFNLNKVNFFREDISSKFLFTDFHGKFSSIKTEARCLPDLLQLYDSQCNSMYIVGATHINPADIANSKDLWRVSAFWYFVFNENWNPTKVKAWLEQRDKTLLALLKTFPKLKFILYQDTCIKGSPSFSY